MRSREVRPAGASTTIRSRCPRPCRALPDGKLKPLAKLAAERGRSALPQFPTMSESGLPGFTSETGTSGLVWDRPGCRRISSAKSTATRNRFLRTDELRQRYEQNGAEPMPGTPAEFEKVQKTEFTRVKRVIEAIGLQPQF